VTYLATGAQVLWNQVQTWTGRANQAWGTSRVWNTGSSFEADLGAMTTDRNTWQSRANSAWGVSRVWNSGSSFESDLAAMTTDRNNWQAASNTWQGRANNAWGTSRVWNSGSSFETDLANMTADRNTWQSRANTAWGPSRVWGSGETWEAAYNRVLPAALTVYQVGIPGQDCSGGDHQIAILTVGITGQYMVGFEIALNPASPSGANNQWCNLKVNVGGVGQVIFITTALSGVSLLSRGGNHWQGAISAGQTVQLTAGGNGSSNGEGNLMAAFIPTQANPH
jgi:hypothetical protein